MFLRFLKKPARIFQFVKSGKKGQWHFAGPHYHQQILFDQCRLYPSLFQLSFDSILYSYQVYFPAVSWYSLAVFDFITCVSFCTEINNNNFDNVLKLTNLPSK